MENITRSGKKMLKHFNKKFNANGDVHFAVTPNKSRKAKLIFDDIEDDNESINSEAVSIKSHDQPSSSSSLQNVGFSYLPTQIRRKILSKPLSFTLMIAGLSGLGKSTFINSLFLTDIYSDKYPGPSERCSKTVSVESTSVIMTENSVSLNITIVDTPGFACNLDNRSCWRSLITYLKEQHCEYLRGEINFDSEIHDSRVHCCLYFIAPTGHGLEKLDLQCMQQLCKHVNLIPVIAKADTMTPEEITMFKQRVRQDLEKNEICVFSFDNCSDELNVDSDSLPFAVAGSNYIEQTSTGQRIHVRKYPWGNFEVDNPSHCDTSLLRNLLIKHCMYDLIESTHSKHYESYRRDCLDKGIITNPIFKHKEINETESTSDLKDFTLMRAIDSRDD